MNPHCSRHPAGMAGVRPTGMTRVRLRAALTLAVPAIGAVIVMALALLTPLFGPRQASPGAWDYASLPDRLMVCGRSYRHDSLDRIRSAAEIKEWQGFPPTVVLPLWQQPCMPGPCSDVAAATPCETVVYVRVGSDAYVDYALQGGP